MAWFGYQRPARKRLHFRTKNALARQMLVELDQLLPKGHKVYLDFDSCMLPKD